MGNHSIQRISVIVPANPFVAPELQAVHHCLTALDVENLMHWWPGTPHTPHRDAQKVTAIQRSLDWKRIAHIAAYLLQAEILDASDRISSYFAEFYGSGPLHPGRQWPPRVSRVIGYERSEFPTFSNILLHVNGASLDKGGGTSSGTQSGHLIFDENNKSLNFSVIDGQHRINGAYLAIRILQEKDGDKKWDIPAEVFLDLDPPNSPPRKQAQIFIDVNFYQKRVDRSLVSDLFPTARGERSPLDDKERAQDLGRRLMLEQGPLVGMVQIPGVKYGVRDVVTLATLVAAIESALPSLRKAGLESIDLQAAFLAQCLSSWLAATGRQEELALTNSLDPENVAYQGRVIVSFLTLIPACLIQLHSGNLELVSDKAAAALTKWLHGVIDRAGLLERDQFVTKTRFKERGFVGSGGLARFRDRLWAAAFAKTRLGRMTNDRIVEQAEKYRRKAAGEL